MAQIIARVKSVVSGDTLVLKSPKSGAEKTVSLAYVTAPRLKREGDEPYAFQSRDFLRKQIVGKEVQFTTLYTIPNTQREYGVIHISNQSVAELSVAEGHLKLREDAGKRDDLPENENLLDKLRLLESQARADKKGLWSTADDGRIEVDEMPSDVKGFLEKHKGQTLSGSIVERVISGDRVAVRLILDEKHHQNIVLVLAGIRAPLSARTDKGLEIPAEELGEEAKQFVEARLLQRSVSIELLGNTPQGQFVGHVIHPAGNIAEVLLVQGYGRCADFHSTMIGADMSKFRAAEKAAKDGKKGIWKGHVVKAKDTGSSFDAVVSRIMSADTLFVRNKTGVERKVNLSSVRQPKPSDPKQATFQAEAKEFLRKKLIGKHVHVTIDGKRPASDGFEEREMATVTFNNNNVALLLVKNGYASVIRHRREDEDRSPIYDDLLAAEEQAMTEQKGMHTSKPPPASKMVEASETVIKAKAYLSQLQRQKRVPAVVDFVASGSRFKVIIPRENARLTFVLGGIRAPKTARNPSEQSEPFGQEALDFTTRRCMQRDVEIDVQDVDRVGGFIGTMYVNRESVAKCLVEEGLASVHSYSAEKSGNGNELFAAESRAKEARKGMWHDWSPENDEEEANVGAANAAGAAEEIVPKKKDYRDVWVTNVDEQGKLKVQLVGTGTAALESLMNAFRTFHVSNTKGLDAPPRAGEHVSAKFTEDDTWYRARVRHVNREAKEAEVLYIDYGNSEKIPFSRLRPLSDPRFQTSKLKPQAIDAMFSFLQFPTQKDYAEDAVEYITRLTAGKQLVANVDWTSPEGVLHLTLYDPKNSERETNSLNKEIIEEGLALVPVKLRPFEKACPEMIAALKEKEVEARGARRNMWEYGDITED